MKHFRAATSMPRVEHERLGTNGRSATGAGLRRIALGLNQVGSICRKPFISARQNLEGAAAGSLAVTTWPFYMRTGEAVSYLAFYVGMGWTDYSLASPPECYISLTTVGGGTVTSNSLYLSVSATSATIYPAYIHHGKIAMAVSANTEYYGHFVFLNGAKGVYGLGVEERTVVADDSVTGVCDPSPYVAEGRIYDANIADLVDASNSLWRHNGCHLLSWVAGYDYGTGTDGYESITWTSDRNILDGGAASTPAATTPGFKLTNSYHGTRNRANAIPVKLAVNVSRITGTSNLDVRVYDGTNEIAINDMTTGGWQTTTGTMVAATDSQYDILADIDSPSGGDEWRIYAVSLFEYEA